MKTLLMNGIAVLVILSTTAALAVPPPPPPPPGDPWIEGHCVSLGLQDGLWTYQLSLSWDTGKHSVSHIDIILDDSGNCTAEDMGQGLFFGEPAGAGLGVPYDCTVEYVAEVEETDPSIDLLAIVMKFEPRSVEDCEPGRAGSAVYEFKSPFRPAAIASENLFLVQKFSNSADYGSLTGEFPGLPCNPVAAETSSWSELKASFR